jgi:hypothetical protein
MSSIYESCACEGGEVCPRCGGINTVRVTQENDYGITTKCGACNNAVYRTKPGPSHNAGGVSK